MLELAILGLLKEQDLHGYDLKKRLGEMLGVLSAVSFGSLYPALARLERAGAVQVVEPAARGKAFPMTGSLGGERAAFRARMAARRPGRSRKVYGITPEGERLFSELLASSDRAGEGDRGFSLRLAFARHLSPDARLRLLERRRAELAQRLDRTLATVRSTGSQLDPYTRSVVEHSTEVTEQDITWLDRLIDAERQSAGRRRRERATRPQTRRTPSRPTTERQTS